jgi:hypothetical protein
MVIDALERLPALFRDQLGGQPSGPSPDARRDSSGAVLGLAPGVSEQARRVPAAATLLAGV